MPLPVKTGAWRTQQSKTLLDWAGNLWGVPPKGKPEAGVKAGQNRLCPGLPRDGLSPNDQKGPKPKPECAKLGEAWCDALVRGGWHR